VVRRVAADATASPAAMVAAAFDNREIMDVTDLLAMPALPITSRWLLRVEPVWHRKLGWFSFAGFSTPAMRRVPRYLYI